MTSSGPPSDASTHGQSRSVAAPAASGNSLDLSIAGRESELAKLATLVASARRKVGGSLVVTGEPGIGKTTLLRAADEFASGFTRLWVRGAEAEQVMAHGGLLQVLGPLRSSLAQVPQGQARALASALGWSPAAASSLPADRFLVAAATMSLLAAQAERAPVLVLVDDLQWLDRESAAALAFAARRLEYDRICFVWSARDGRAVDQLLPDAPRLTLAGLDRRATRLLVADRVDPLVADRLVEDTAGNPLALLEIAAGLSDAQRRGTEPLPERLPVGERLQASFQRLLERLSPPSQRAVLLCALDGSGSTATVAQALAIDGIDGAAAIDEAVDRGILVGTEAGLRFRHPLLRNTALVMATAAEQRHGHRILAAALAEAADPFPAIWHRAAAVTVDPVVSQDLVRLAEQIRARTGYAAASTVLERAAALTADGAAAAELLADAAAEALLAGDVARAQTLADRVLRRSSLAWIRGRALLTLGEIEVCTGSVPGRSRSSPQPPSPQLEPTSRVRCSSSAWQDSASATSQESPIALRGWRMRPTRRIRSSSCTATSPRPSPQQSAATRRLPLSGWPALWRTSAWRRCAMTPVR